MDGSTISSVLDGLPIPQFRYFESIGSTNDEALEWASSGAADGCLVIADLQTQGRGRLGRRWVTHPGGALAFSLILRPRPEELEHLGYFAALGAVSICQALEASLGTVPQIKWPNDVLLERRKAAGILVEAAWLGDRLEGVVIGIGLNVRPDAVPPADQLLFPAISVEEAAGRPVDRLPLLRDILRSMFAWREGMASARFREEWENRLAFRGEWVQIQESAAGSPPIVGQVTGLDGDGSLLLRSSSGEDITIAVGDVHLRPMM